MVEVARVELASKINHNSSHSQAYQFLYPLTEWVDGYIPKLTVLLP